MGVNDQLPRCRNGCLDLLAKLNDVAEIKRHTDIAMIAPNVGNHGACLHSWT